MGVQQSVTQLPGTCTAIHTMAEATNTTKLVTVDGAAMEPPIGTCCKRTYADEACMNLSSQHYLPSLSTGCTQQSESSAIKMSLVAGKVHIEMSDDDNCSEPLRTPPDSPWPLDKCRQASSGVYIMMSCVIGRSASSASI